MKTWWCKTCQLSSFTGAVHTTHWIRKSLSDIYLHIWINFSQTLQTSIFKVKCFIFFGWRKGSVIHLTKMSKIFLTLFLFSSSELISPYIYAVYVPSISLYIHIHIINILWSISTYITDLWNRSLNMMKIACLWCIMYECMHLGLFYDWIMQHLLTITPR